MVSSLHRLTAAATKQFLVAKLHSGTGLSAQLYCFNLLDSQAGSAMELPQPLRSQMEFGNEETMQPLLKTLLIICWVGVNFTALGMIIEMYPTIWHYSALSNSVSHEQVQRVAASASRDQIAKLLVDGDTLSRGALRQLVDVLNNWLGITLLNVVITLGYCYHHKQKASS